jgi:hypothetical protein
MDFEDTSHVGSVWGIKKSVLLATVNTKENHSRKQIQYLHVPTHACCCNDFMNTSYRYKMTP